MNAGAINFLVMRFDEQPVLESDLPQIAAGVFQADDGHGGIAGDFARGVRAHACARFGLLAPHACRQAVSGVYPRMSALRQKRTRAPQHNLQGVNLNGSCGSPTPTLSKIIALKFS